MVKLTFNPKKDIPTDIVGKISKKKEINLNPFSDLELPDITALKITDTLKTSDIVGLDKYHFVLKKWYFESLVNRTKQFLLIIGPVGCGKTTLTELFCNENDISLYSIRMDNKLKKDLLKEIYNFSEYNFWNSNSKKLILIDEYQNGINDLLSITDIINLQTSRKDTLLPPVLIISADSKGSKLSDLKKCCETYYINEINLDIIHSWINNFLKREIDIEIIRKCKSDKRLLLNNCNAVNSFYKDSDVNIYEFIDTLFLENVSIKEMFKVYETDGFLLSNVIHENYLDYHGSIENIAKAADAISLGEVIFSDTYESTKTFLPDFHFINSMYIPSYYCKSEYKKNKCQIRSSCINNRFNIFLNNKKLIDKLNLSVYDIFLIKKFLNHQLVKVKVLSTPQEDFLRSILNTIGIEKLEIIFKHFSEFKDLNDSKTKNFTLKFKDKLNKL
jgi:hypothetical protein